MEQLPPSAAPNTDRTGVFTPGEVVNRKYVVERVIGEGGLGVVVSARHRETLAHVAIKIARAADPDTTLRFRLDARAMATLKSPHAIRIVEVGETDGGLPCFVMELLEGQDLASRLRETGAVAIDEAVRWMSQACEAIGEAHKLQIFHRVLKPENLFLARHSSFARAGTAESLEDSLPSTSARAGSSRDLTIKVLDFGMTLPFPRMTESEMRVTTPGGIVGTSYYLAPEQVRNREIDERTDIWAVGACLFRLLTNRYPFTGTNVAEVSAGILTLRPTEIRTLRADIPAPMVEVISRCLQKNPKDRYESMTELRAAIGSMQDTYSSVRNTPVVAVVQRVLEELRPTPHMQRAADKVDLPPDSVNPTPMTMRIAPAQPFPHELPPLPVPKKLGETMTQLREASSSASTPITDAAPTPQQLIQPFVAKGAVPLPPAETATNIRNHVDLPPLTTSPATIALPPIPPPPPITPGFELLKAPVSEDPTMIRGLAAGNEGAEDEDESEGRTKVRETPSSPASIAAMIGEPPPESSDDQTMVRGTGAYPIAADPPSSTATADSMPSRMIANESDVESVVDSVEEKKVPQLAQLLNLPIILKRKEEAQQQKAQRSVGAPTALAIGTNAQEQKVSPALMENLAPPKPIAMPTTAAMPSPIAGQRIPTPAPMAPIVDPFTIDPFKMDPPKPALSPVGKYEPVIDQPPPTPFSPLQAPPPRPPTIDSIEAEIVGGGSGSNGGNGGFAGGATRIGAPSSPPMRNAQGASPFIMSAPLVASMQPGGTKTADSREKVRDQRTTGASERKKSGGTGFIVAFLLLAIVGGGGWYLYRSKRLPASITRLINRTSPDPAVAPTTIVVVATTTTTATTPPSASSGTTPPASATTTTSTVPSATPPPSTTPTTTATPKKPVPPRPQPQPRGDDTPKGNSSGGGGGGGGDDSILNKRK